MEFISKLPNTTENIFSVMTGLSKEHDAINLAQGFPDFPSDPKLIEIVHHYMSNGFNQYAPMPGVLPLRKALCQKINKLYGSNYNPNSEITITAGATQAIYTAITTIVQAGDEVIIIEPAYDSYLPAVLLNKGIPKFYTLKAPDFSVDWEELEKLITPKTKLLIVNTPHNPTGTLLQKKDLDQIERLIAKYNFLLLSDEVYEHITFDGQAHASVASYPQLKNNSLICFSFGKVFHNTGWKTGYIVGPEWLMSEFQKVHQFEVFSCNTPLQYAFADYLEDEQSYKGLSPLFEAKRDLALAELKESQFDFIPCQGTYFQLLSYKKLSNEGDLNYAKKITKDAGVALIPISAFYHDGFDEGYVRLCFAKKDEVILNACSILKNLS